VTPPTFRIGDLVRYNSSSMDLDDLSAVGIILDMRAMTLRPSDAKILWNDMPDPRWIFISDLAPMQPDREPGITG
jgi:hypothetical protein